MMSDALFAFGFMSVSAVHWNSIASQHLPRRLATLPRHDITRLGGILGQEQDDTGPQRTQPQSAGPPATGDLRPGDARGYRKILPQAGQGAGPIRRLPPDEP